MKKLLCTLALSVLLAGCSTALENVQKETGEAITNLQTEANNVTETVTEKVDQVNGAVESVNNAVESVNQAVEDVKAVGK
jgi:starvation-inducible outer membrane lipoprotein